ncbi:AEC family transporter [Methanobrevibacter sp.]|uniref:AEC family transporter n=1 Tax=Methanobrevibacter sp. TaxID=66852 RepID=UPI0025F7D58B|nr:AEC family transporter [Methanobrevibacter sp.]MBQ6511572.1 AEC family transporter [Methanobrevibacter sp.]
MASPIEVIMIPALMMLLGFILKYVGFFEKSDRDLISNIVLYIALPAMIFTNLRSANISHDMLFLPIIGIITSILLLIPAYLYCRIRNYDKKTTWTILIASSIMNTGFIGFPVCMGVFGQQGFLNAVFYDLSTSAMVVAYGVILARKFSGNAREVIINTVTFMPLWAVIFGLIFNAFDISLGYVLDSILNYLSDATIPMIMLALGISLDFSNVADNITDSAVVAIIKLIISPLIVFALLMLLNIKGLVFNVAILEAGMSTAGNALVLAITYDLDKDLMGSIIFTNVVASVITLTAIISLLTGAI